jgi:hypothetical protein
VPRSPQVPQWCSIRVAPATVSAGWLWEMRSAIEARYSLAVHELRSAEGNGQSDSPGWKLLGLKTISLNWRRARMSVCCIAIMTVVHPAQCQETKPAEPSVAAANRAVQSQLPFGDRQDFDDAMRGFIATAPDPNNPEGCLHSKRLLAARGVGGSELTPLTCFPLLSVLILERQKGRVRITALPAILRSRRRTQ